MFGRARMIITRLFHQLVVAVVSCKEVVLVALLLKDLHKCLAKVRTEHRLVFCSSFSS